MAWVMLILPFLFLAVALLYAHAPLWVVAGGLVVLLVILFGYSAAELSGRQ